MNNIETKHCRESASSRQLNELSAPPSRAWRSFVGEVARHTGLGLVMGGASLALNVALCWQADAGYILSQSQGGDDSYAKQQGAARTISNGGIQGWFSAEYDSPLGGRSTIYSSAFAYTPKDISLANHQIVPYLNLNPTFRFGTGTNYFTDPGTVYQLNSWALTPGWVNSLSNSSIADQAVGHLDGQIDSMIGKTITFATERPAAGTIINFAGYGQPGSPDTGLRPADGYIRFGTAKISSSAPFGGASPSLFIQTNWTNDGVLLPNGNMATQGDSTALGVDEFNRILLQYTRGAVDPNIGIAYALDLVNPDAQKFMRDNQSYDVTSVPEPSSLLLAGITAGLMICLRNRRKRSNEN